MEFLPDVVACPSLASPSNLCLLWRDHTATYSEFKKEVRVYSVLSTTMHKFAQTFFPISIDAENGKVYLPPQIEPEA
jgi:hypothetical protein